MALDRVHGHGGDEEAGEVAAHRPQHAQARGVPRVARRRDLAAVDPALEQRLPALLVVAAHQLRPAEPALPDEVGQLPLVVVADAPAHLDVVDGRSHGLSGPGRQHLRGDGGGGGGSGGGGRRDGGRRARRRGRSRLGEGARPRAAGQRGQPRSQLVRPGEAAPGILLQAARDEGLQGLGDVAAQPPQRLRVPLDHGGEHLRGRVAPEGRTPGGHLVEDEAEGELVRPVVHGPAAGLLGRHVLERAQRLPRRGQRRPRRAAQPFARHDLGDAEVEHLDEVGRRPRLEEDVLRLDVARSHHLGQPEVEDLDHALRSHHHVLGLEVAMDDARAMGLREPVGELRAEVEQLGDGGGARTQAAAQRLALHQLHHHVVRARAAGRLADVVDVDDVGMVEGGGRARLAVEAPQQLGVGAGAQHLEGDRPAQPRVPRAVDLAHAARAQAVDDLVRADARSGGEGVVHLAAAYHPLPGEVEVPIVDERP